MENWINLFNDASDLWASGSEKHGKELERARALKNEKNYEEALKAYVKVFEEGRDTSPLVGVRLSYVLSEMAEIGKLYEPARTMLLGYREAHEQIMLSGKFSLFSIQEWAAFCEYTAPNRKIEFYNALKVGPTRNEELLTDIRRLIWLELIEMKLYEEFSPSELAIRLKEVALVSWQGFSANSFVNKAMPHLANDSQLKQFAVKQLLQHSGAIYECAIGLKKHSLAKKAFKLATYYQRTGKAYACFLIAASRAGDLPNAKKIASDARRSLPENEMRAVNAVMEKLNL